MRQKTFGNIGARECQSLNVRLPPDVVRKLDAVSGGKGARALLTTIGLTIAGGHSGGIYAQSNQAKAG